MVKNLCPDPMCKPYGILAEIHFFKFYNLYGKKQESFATLVCLNHQKPYAQASNTTFWSADMVKQYCSDLEKGNNYQICTGNLNRMFGIGLSAKQRRDKKGRSKGIDGEVVKKLVKELIKTTKIELASGINIGSD